MWGNEKEQDEFDTWMSMWDKASKKMGGPKAAPPQSGQSYFGLQEKPIPYDEAPSDEEASTWCGLHADYADRLAPPRRDPELYHEAGLSALGDLGKPGSMDTDFDKVMKHPYDWLYRYHPVQKSTVGGDASEAPEKPTRVTPNFNDGERLRRLAELNDLIHHLHAIHWRAASEGKDKRAKKIQRELDSVLKEKDMLSNTLVPHPELDLA